MTLKEWALFYVKTFITTIRAEAGHSLGQELLQF